MEKIFANQRAGSVLLTVWKNSIENKIVDLKKMCCFHNDTSPASVEMVCFSFALYMGGFQAVLQWKRAGCNFCVISQKSGHFSDLIYKWQNTVCGSFSLKVPVCYQLWYSALL